MRQCASARCVGALLLLLVGSARAGAATLAQVRASYDAGRYREVIEMVDREASIRPENLQLLLYRGLAHVKLEACSLAVRDFSNVIGMNPGYSYARFLRGNAYKAIGRIDSALMDYDLAASMNPSLCAELYGNRAEARLASGDTAGSVDDAVRYIRLNQPGMLTQAANCISAGGQPYAAAVLARLTAVDSGDWQQLLVHGLALHHAQLDSAATTELAKGTAVAAADTASLRTAAGWLEANRLLDIAAAAYAQLLVSQPEEPRTIAHLAFVLMQQNEPDSALPLLRRAFHLSLARGDSVGAAEICFRLGEVYERKGMSTDAEIQRIRAEGLAPGSDFGHLLPAEPRLATATSTAPQPVVADEPDTLGLPLRNDVFVLAAGVASHKYATVPTCPFAGADAESVSATMLSRFAGRVPPVNVRTIVDTAATYLDIRKGLRWLGSQARAANGLAFFFFSGHGMTLSVAADGKPERFLVPYDCDPSDLAITGLPVGSVMAALSGLGNARAFVAFDACFSGSGRSLVVPGERAVVVRRREPARRPEVPQPLAVLSACGSDEVAIDDSAAGHGLFSRYLIEALSGRADDCGNADGWVEPAEILRFVTDSVVPRAMQLSGADQHPELSGSAVGALITPNVRQLIAAARAKRIRRLSDALASGAISNEQFDCALGEIRSGRCGGILNLFLDGKLSSEDFGRLYSTPAATSSGSD